MKDGTITTAETEALREEAIKLLQKLKQDPKEQKKVPIRINKKTILLVSNNRQKDLKNY